MIPDQTVERQKAAPHPRVEEAPGILAGVNFPLAIASSEFTTPAHAK
jgi:hypothetical protein